MPESRDYQRIERAIEYLAAHYREQPELADVARAVGLSEFHFQRLFTRWAGISPKKFVQALTAGFAGRLLRDGETVLGAAYGAGLSGPGRLHDLMINVTAATPGEHRSGGVGLEIATGIHESPFGPVLAALTPRGLCGLAFVEGGARDAEQELHARWPRAHFRTDDRATGDVVRRIFAPRPGDAVSLLLRGTPFQVQVWEALLRIPAGTVTSYQDLAVRIGAPTASRAVGAAVGRNPIAFLIPCHRVIRRNGAVGEYHWGEARKHALLAWEMAG